MDRCAQTTHVLAAGAVACAVSMVECLVGPGPGAFVKIAGVAAIAGIAVSATACVARRHAHRMPAAHRRTLLERTAREVVPRHEGLWSAWVLSVGCELLGLRPGYLRRSFAAHLGRGVLSALVRPGRSRLSLLGTSVSVAQGYQLTIQSAGLVRDFEATAMALCLTVSAPTTAA